MSHGVGEDAGGGESPESWLAMWDSMWGETTAVATNRGGEVVVGEGARGGRRRASSRGRGRVELENDGSLARIWITLDVN